MNNANMKWIFNKIARDFTSTCKSTSYSCQITWIGLLFMHFQNRYMIKPVLLHCWCQVWLWLLALIGTTLVQQNTTSFPSSCVAMATTSTAHFGKTSTTFFFANDHFGKTKDSTVCGVSTGSVLTDVCSCSWSQLSNHNISMYNLPM